MDGNPRIIVSGGSRILLGGPGSSVAENEFEVLGREVKADYDRLQSTKTDYDRL